MSNILDELSSSNGEFKEFSPSVMIRLQTIAKWTKFVGIASIVFGSLGILMLIIMGLVGAAALTTAVTVPHTEAFGVAGILVLVLLVMLIFIYIAMLLNSYSNALEKFTISSNMEDYAQALVIWNRFWLWATVVSVFGIVLSILGVIAGFVSFL